MKLKDKIAIVTGASGGIGAAIAHAYAKEGALVIVVNKNNPQKGIQVANEIKQEGGQAKAIACDVSNLNAVKNMVAQVINEYGRIDILVNNAGTLIFKNFEDETEEDWDKTLDTNLKGPFLLSQAVVPYMKKQHSGKIIFTSSLAAIRGVAGAISYSASKGGVLAMARSMVAELAQYGININLISPGFTATPMNQNFRNDPHFMEQIKFPPSGIAIMEPMDIATAAVFLASEDAKMIHGLDLIVDGGASAVQ
jgi:NAD(P)-dependent dehydrogenase (short-subunit alcohol dehydrogenase family)